MPLLSLPAAAVDDAFNIAARYERCWLLADIYFSSLFLRLIIAAITPVYYHLPTFAGRRKP